MKKIPMQEAESRGLAHIAARLEFFRSFNGAQLERLFSRVELYGFERGETIFHKGNSPMAFYLIFEGRVKIHLGYHLWGLMRKMAHLGQGDLFGEMALIEKRPHSGTAIAEEPTKLFILAYEYFDELLKSDPEFADLMKFVVARRKSDPHR